MQQQEEQRFSSSDICLSQRRAPRLLKRSRSFQLFAFDPLAPRGRNNAPSLVIRVGNQSETRLHVSVTGAGVPTLHPPRQPSSSSSERRQQLAATRSVFPFCVREIRITEGRGAAKLFFGRLSI